MSTYEAVLASAKGGLTSVQLQTGVRDLHQGENIGKKLEAAVGLYS